MIKNHLKKITVLIIFEVLMSLLVSLIAFAVINNLYRINLIVILNIYRTPIVFIAYFLLHIIINRNLNLLINIVLNICINLILFIPFIKSEHYPFYKEDFFIIFLIAIILSPILVKSEFVQNKLFSKVTDRKF